MMIIIISIILVNIFFFIQKDLFSCSYSLFDKLLEVVMGLLISIFIGGLIGFIIAIALPMSKKTEEYSSNILNLKDFSSTEGSFYLGCGYIGTEMMYSFYYEYDNGYKLCSISSSLAEIRYTDDRPTVHVTKTSLTDSIINYFALDFEVDKYNYIIYIPRGSILNNYKLDAE